MNQLRNTLGALALGLSLVAAPVAAGATLSLEGVTRVNTNPVVPPFDLSDAGGVDWAYWNQTSGTGVATMAPGNEKAGGTAISDLAPSGGATVRGTGSATTVGRYSWSDGASTPTSGTNQPLTGGLIFNSTIGSTNGNGLGVQFTLVGDPTTARDATLYFGGFSATGNLTLEMNGVSTVVDSSQVFTAIGPKQMAVYRVRYQPDSVNDVLTVRYTATSITDGNGHVGVQAVAVAVPEPGVIGLGVVGIGMCLARRRAR